MYAIDISKIKKQKKKKTLETFLVFELVCCCLCGGKIKIAISMADVL